MSPIKCFLLMLLLTGNAFAKDTLNCGNVELPLDILPSKGVCVGEQNGSVIVAGGDTIRFIKKKYNSDIQNYEFKIVSEISKNTSNFLREYCGRSLLTARIIDNGSKVLLFYSQVTVVSWNVFNNSVSQLITRVDPDMISFCGGVETGPNAMVDELIFNEYERFFAISAINGEIVRMKF